MFEFEKRPTRGYRLIVDRAIVTAMIVFAIVYLLIIVYYAIRSCVGLPCYPPIPGY